MRAKVDAFRYSPFIAFIFKFNSSKNAFYIEQTSLEAENFFGVDFFDDKEKDLRSFWSNFILKEDLDRIFTYANDVKSTSLNKLSFTCRGFSKIENRFVFLAGFMKVKNVDEDKYVYVTFHPLEDIEMLDEAFFDNLVPAQQLLSDVLATTNIPIYWADSTLRFLGVNKAFLEYFKLSDEAFLLGKRLDELSFFSPSMAKYIMNNQTKILENKIEQKGELSFVLNSQTHYISYNEKPMYKNGEVIGIVGSFVDITAEKMSENKLKELADHDSLTNIYNRRYFFETFEKMVEEKQVFTLVMLDLDGFKCVNDNIGHDAGDYVLKRVANNINNIVRDIGFVARYGGDEFVCCLFTSNEKAVRILLSDIQESVRSISSYQESPIEIDVSFGYVLSTTSSNTKKLLEEADKLMYLNKNQKKGR